MTIGLAIIVGVILCLLILCIFVFRVFSRGGYSKAFALFSAIVIGPIVFFFVACIALYALDPCTRIEQKQCK